MGAIVDGLVYSCDAIALEIDPEPPLRFAIDPLSLTRIDQLTSGWLVCVNC